MKIKVLRSLLLNNMVCLSATWVQARPPFSPSPNSRHCLRLGASVGRKTPRQAGEQFNLFTTEVPQPRSGCGCPETEAAGPASRAGLKAWAPGRGSSVGACTRCCALPCVGRDAGRPPSSRGVANQEALCICFGLGHFQNQP